MLSAAFTAILLFFLVRALGPRDYGIFALTITLGTVGTFLSNVGISQATARFVAEYRDDRAAVAAVVADALRLKLLVTGLFCVGLVAAAGPLAAAYDTPELVWPIRIFALSLLGESLFGLLGQLTEAERRVAIYLRAVGIEASIETAASITLVLAGLGVSGAIAGRGGAYLVGAAYGLALIARRLEGRSILRRRGAGNIRRILQYGSALIVVDAAFVLFSSIDSLLIGSILGVAAVGQFSAAMRLLTFLGYAAEAAASGVAPRLTRAAGASSSSALNFALRRLMAFQGIFIAPLIVWAEPLTQLAFGDDYTDSAEVLRAITPFAFLLAISPVLARGVTYLGEARLRIPIAIAALLVNFVFDLIMLPRIGIVAGAYGTDIAYALYVGAHLWICHRLLGTPLRPLALTLLRVLAAAAVMSLVLVGFGTGEVAFPLLLAGGAVGCLAYGGALLLMREVTPNDVRQARTWVRARRPRRRGRAG